MIKDIFNKQFNCDPDFIIKAPGRTELGGNHTDHQHGCVLAGPVDLFVTAAVKANDSDKIRVYSEGYELVEAELGDLDIDAREYGSLRSLVKGIAADFITEGLKGFDACIRSEVPVGSGLSSSAAIEILLGKICCRLTDAVRTPVQLAQLGQYVENSYFGKPCGLMDQMACAHDGIIAIDFKDPKSPVVEELTSSFSDYGYELCIIPCGAGHENLTDNYADITKEMAAVSACFGKEILREVEEEAFYQNISVVRDACGDRAVLRTIHFFDEQKRVSQLVKALREGNFERYLQLVNESGMSSWVYLQNVIPEGAVMHQEMAFSLALAKKALEGRGAVRVHGGGFAGTIQAYVPSEMKESFQKRIERVLGEKSCIFVNIGKDI